MVCSIVSVFFCVSCFASGCVCLSLCCCLSLFVLVGVGMRGVVAVVVCLMLCVLSAFSYLYD